MSSLLHAIASLFSGDFSAAGQSPQGFLGNIGFPIRIILILQGFKRVISVLITGSAPRSNLLGVEGADLGSRSRRALFNYR